MVSVLSAPSAAIMVSFQLLTATIAALASIAQGLPSKVSPTPLDSSINPAFPYGSSKVRGVNLGGWLVLEVCQTTT
jgi:hypothetical protein